MHRQGSHAKIARDQSDMRQMCRACKRLIYASRSDGATDMKLALYSEKRQETLRKIVAGSSVGFEEQAQEACFPTCSPSWSGLCTKHHHHITWSSEDLACPLLSITAMHSWGPSAFSPLDCRHVILSRQRMSSHHYYSLRWIQHVTYLLLFCAQA